MQKLVAQGSDIETVAATFMVTPAVVKQRLKLADVSPKLHDIYAEDGMTLDQLMAFSVASDHARQEQVWDMLQTSHNQQPWFIRARLTEDKRSEEHTSELQSLMRISYAVFCLKKKKITHEDDLQLTLQHTRKDSNQIIPL